MAGDSCANCGAALTGRFCAACGQEALRDLRVRAVVRDAAAGLFDLDSRTWATLRALFTAPGALSGRYRDGQRVRFIAPLRLYLLASVLLFAALEFAPIPAVARVNIDGTEQGAHLERTDVWGRMARAAQDPERLNRAFLRGVGWAMFLLIPLFAVMLKLAWARRGLLYAHHLVFALHVHAFAFLCMAAALALMHVTRLAGPAGAAVPAAAAALANVAYLVLSARRFYAAGLVSTLLRLVLVAATYAFSVGAVMLVILGLVLLLF
jgi:hypothetical protein